MPEDQLIWFTLAPTPPPTPPLQYPCFPPGWGNTGGKHWVKRRTVSCFLPLPSLPEGPMEGRSGSPPEEDGRADGGGSSLPLYPGLQFCASRNTDRVYLYDKVPPAGVIRPTLLSTSSGFRSYIWSRFTGKHPSVQSHEVTGKQVIMA